MANVKDAIANSNQTKSTQGSPTASGKAPQSATPTTAPPTTTPTTAPTNGSATDFSSFASQYGGASDSSYYNEDDPDVLITKRDYHASYNGGSTLIKTDTPAVKKKQSEVLRDFYRLQGPELKALKERLFKGGFYGSLKRNQINWSDTPGDDLTLEAYKGATVRAAGIHAVDQTKSLDDVIDEGSQTGDQSGSEGNVLKLTNPDDIAAVIKSSAKQLLGRGVSQADIDRITSAFHAQELQAQQTKVAATDTGVDTTVTDAPSLETFTTNAIAKANPGEAQAHAVNDLGDVVSKAINDSTNTLIRS